MTITSTLRLVAFSAALVVNSPASSEVDFKLAVAVAPFESAVKVSPGFTDVARTTVVAHLKEDKTFSGVFTSEETKEKAPLELTARLVEFKAGNMATRVLVGLGSGRASAAFDFALKDSQSGKVVWKKTIKEKASVWSNSASSTAQRLELPEKIARALIKELQKDGKL
jgi:hypothetical protein